MAAKNNRTATAVKKERPAPQADTAAAGKPSLTKEQLVEMYTLLVRCRQVDERARLLFRQGKFKGNFYSAVGQEATHVGTLYGSRKSDWVGPSHRDSIAGIVKGVPLKSYFCQLFANIESPDRGKTTPAHYGNAEFNIIIPSSTIAAQWQLATGVAFGLKMLRKDDICFAYCGDGATSTGAWHEAVNFAAVHKLGIVYVVQNNLWAESVPLRLQSVAKTLADKAVGYGFPGVVVDGNDLLAVYQAAQEAIQRARAGEGPTLIECKTYRWYGHSEIDPAKYRPKEEVEEWKKRDPIPRFEQHLRGERILTDELKKKIEAGVKEEIDRVVLEAEKVPYPNPEEALEHIYAE
ncbi:MAG: thiamine pyrophosphate-dependent dehydrogenase E1 component subunit alpha [Candidatus Acidiferrales bacterium]